MRVENVFPRQRFKVRAQMEAFQIICARSNYCSELCVKLFGFWMFYIRPVIHFATNEPNGATLAFDSRVK
jgi:hypothetical protein